MKKRKMRPFILITFIEFLVFAFTGNVISAEEGALLIYSFDEGQGTTVKDLSGNGNDGTFQGDATWTKDGKFKGGASFDGDGDYVECEPNDALNLIDTDFTLSAWVYPTAIQQHSFGGGIGGTIFGTSESGGWHGYLIGIRDNAKLWWWNQDNTDKFSDSTIPLDKWTHVAVVFHFKGGGNKNVLEFYIDGNLDSTAQSVSDNELPDNVPLRVGHRSWCTGWFQGVIDEARVYAKALSKDEVDSVMETSGAAVDAEEKLTTLWGTLKG